MSVENQYQMSSDWKNSVDYKPVIYDLIEAVMLFCIVFPALALIYGWFETGLVPWLRPLWLFAAMIAMTLGRRRAKRLFVYAALLVAVIGMGLLIPAPLPCRILTAAALVTAAGVSIHKLRDAFRRAARLNDPDIQVSDQIFAGSGLLLGGIATLYLTFMISLALRAVGLPLLCILMLALLLVCYYIYTHITGSYCLIEWKNDRSGALGQIRRFNLFFACVGAAVVAVTGLLTYVIVYTTGLSGIDDRMIDAFRHAAGYTGSTRTSPQPVHIPQAGDMQNPFLKFSGQKPGLVMQILAKVLTVAGWIIVAAVLLLMLLLLIRVIFNFFRGLRAGINEETRSVFSAREAFGTVTEKIRHSGVAVLLTGSSNRMKIRRLYYRLVRGYQTKGLELTGADSPAEIAEKIGRLGGRDVSAATGVYEKARYAPRDCTKEDVEIFKNSTR